MKRALLFSLLLLLSGCALIPASAPKQIACFSESTHSIIEELQSGTRLYRVAAHRALGAGLPENSVEAVRLLVEKRVPLIEIDVRFDASKSLIIFHDSRVTEKNSFAPLSLYQKKIKDLTPDEIREIEHPKAYHIPIPHLKDLILAVRGSRTALQLDLKDSSMELIEKVGRELRTYGGTKNAVLQLRNKKGVLYLKEHFPELEFLYRATSEEALHEIIPFKPLLVELEGWSSPEALELLQSYHIAALNNLAAPIYDYPLLWSSSYNKGFSIIMTDRPLALLEWLSSGCSQ